MAAMCSAIAKAGSRCGRPALAGGAFCLMHSPDHAEVRLEAARKGGRNRSSKARAAKQLPEAMAPEELAGWLAHTFKRVITGTLDPKVGTAAAAIARVMIEATTAADFDKRLAALEAGADFDRRVA